MSASQRTHIFKRVKGALFLGVLSCLWFTQCVVGGEGAPCKANNDCGGNNVCVSGLCFNAGVEITPGEIPADTRVEPGVEPGVEPAGEPGDDASNTKEPQTDGEPTLKDAVADTGEALPEEAPELINYGPQRRIGLSSGGGRMSSVDYRLYGSISAGLLGTPTSMASPSYKLKAGLLSGTQP